MKLEDFKLADCALLRRPPVAVDDVNRRIETVLVEAWTGGASAEEAVESLLSNRELFEALARRMESNLEYQRKLRLQAVERRSADDQRERNARKQQELAALRKRRRAEEAKLDAARETLDANQRAVSAARERVERLRSRVERQKVDLGGEEGLEVLESLKTDLPALVPGSSKTDAAAPSAEPLRTSVVGAPPPQPEATPAAQPAQTVGASEAVETVAAAGPSEPQRASVPGVEVETLEDAAQVPAAEIRRPRWLFSGRLFHWFQRTPRRRKVFSVISHELW